MHHETQKKGSTNKRYTFCALWHYGSLIVLNADILMVCLLYYDCCNFLSLSVPKRTISDDNIEKVAVHIGSDWRRLGVKLGFVKGELDAFEYDHREGGLHEIIYQMLLTWKEKQGTEATTRYVATQLVAIKRPDVAILFSVT